MHRLADLEDENRIAVALGAAVPAADIGRHVAHAHVLVLQVDARRLFVLGPAAQHVFDARIGMIGVMRRVRVIHGRDVGQHRRPHIVVVVGGDAHELRAFDQKRRVADIADAHLVGSSAARRKAAGCANGGRGGHQARTAFSHFRLGRGRRRALRQGLAARRQYRAGRRRNNLQRMTAHEIDPRQRDGIWHGFSAARH